MKLTTSWLKTDKSLKVGIKNELRRNLFFLLFTPFFAGLVSLAAAAFYISLSGDYVENTQVFEVEQLTYLIPYVTGALCLFIGAIMSFVNFRFLYNRRTVDFFQALPVNRTTQFVAKAVPQLIVSASSFLFSIAVPFIIKFALKIQGSKIIFSPKSLLICTVLSFLGVMANIFLYNFVAVSVGKTWHFILFYFLSAFAQDGVAKLFVLPSAQIPGFGVKWASLSHVFIPSYAIGFSPSKYGVGSGVVALGICAVAFVLFLLGMWQYNRRKNECAGFSLSGRLMIALLTGGTALNFFSWVKTPSKFYFNIIIGCVLSFILFILAGAIFFKKPFEKNLFAEYGILAIVMSALLCFCSTGAFSLANRLPQVGQIDFVEVQTDDELETTTSNSLKDGFSFFATKLEEDYTDNNELSYNLKASESISKVLEVHSLANKEFKERSTAMNNSTIRFKYHLKNGRTITRPVYYNNLDFTEYSYSERIGALPEARKILLKEYDPKAYAPVINFVFDAWESNFTINNYDMLADIYNDYLALSYDEALSACNNDIDNMQVTVLFANKKDYPNKVINSSDYNVLYSGDVDFFSEIELKLPKSCKKTLGHLMKLCNITGFATIDDVNENTVEFVVKEEILSSDYYSPFETKSNLPYELLGVRFASENVFGKYPLSGEYSFLQSAGIVLSGSETDKKALELLKTEIALNQTVKNNDDENLGYAVSFKLKDGSITPVYYVRDAVRFTGEFEEMEDW